jgi:hypothetical protein
VFLHRIDRAWSVREHGVMVRGPYPRVVDTGWSITRRAAA